ncbi:MAG: hypothetical protein KatS3mg008_1927 [Acidimicrobiales bacterium]|nr:MAG: hypothetical protein KatS3mg008_1927 [Acidimicrobiales bacterium]
MTTRQVDYTPEELLASHDYAEPLVVGGVRCHGGFDDDGNYVPPRTLHRWEAIKAWDEQRAEQFGTPKIDIPVDSWPEHFPNVEQTRILLRAGVREPTITELTRIGTVEGFGAMLRYAPLPDLRRCFVEDISGTAVAHLDRGLFEAHARDEAGFGEEAGHNRMWFAARDVAFENPVTEDQTQLMLERMGIPTGGPEELAKLRQAAEAMRLLPSDIPFELESLVARMIRLLFIEISAYHAFEWAEAVLSDPDLVAGEGEAGRLVSYIRADEAPHVAYLATALSEMRDRTWVGESGRRWSGAEMIGRLWDAALEQSRGQGRQQFLEMTWRELQAAVEGRADADDLLEEFWSLGSVRRLEDGTWVDETDLRGRSVEERSTSGEETR